MGKKTERFICFGDSISFGQHIPHHKTWVSTLSKSIFNLLPNKEIILNNLSTNGNTTKQALERLEFDVLSHKPEHVAIQFCLNDCNYWQTDNGLPRVSYEKYQQNLRDIIRKSLEVENMKSIFVLSAHPTNKAPINIGNRTIDYNLEAEKYSQSIEDLADSFNSGKIHFIDTYQSVKNHQNNSNDYSHLLEDGIHLSNDGHNLYSSIVGKSVARVLRALQ